MGQKDFITIPVSSPSYWCG